MALADYIPTEGLFQVGQEERHTDEIHAHEAVKFSASSVQPYNPKIEGKDEED